MDHAAWTNRVRIDARVPIIAHLRGGPLDGEERLMFRSTPIYREGLPRGRLRRSLGRPARYARYEVTDTWIADDDLQHGEYHFTGIVAPT